MNRPVEVLQRLSVKVSEASAMTGISKDILYRHIASGNLIAIKASSSFVIDLDDLKSFLQDQKKGPGEDSQPA